MRRRFLPLIGALLVLAGLASVALMQGGPAGTAAPLSVASQTNVAADAPVAPATPASEAAGEQTPEPTPSTETARVLTGCGRPTPCPDRSCEDCPRNTYLR